MLNNMKDKTWNILKKRGISLAMIFDIEGEILWRRGRNISGRTIERGKGFSKTPIKKAIHGGKEILEKNKVIKLTEDNLSDTAKVLKLKTTIVFPLNKKYFFYIDSEKRNNYTPDEIENLRHIMDIFGYAIDYLRKRETTSDGIVGASELIKTVREKVVKYSVEEGPILITGETGVGKNFIALHIYRNSGRDGEFVTVNCPNIPQSLFESELFGHYKGAFTGATNGKIGLVEKAKRGLLFFDEITEVPLSFQSKLLEFIDTKKYRKIGSTRTRKATLKIVVATNKLLEEEVKKGKFREDLYHRLNCFRLHIPALRERKKDILPLIKSKIEILKGKEISKDGLELLKKYEWPGNIRELFNVLRVLAAENRDKEISKEDIKFILENNRVGLMKDNNNVTSFVWSKIEKGENFWKAVKEPFMNRDICREHVKEIIEFAIKKSKSRYYKDCLKYLNIKQKNHKKFLDFIRNYRIK